MTTLSGPNGKRDKASATFGKGDEIHFWEDFRVSGSTLGTRDACRRWRIEIRVPGEKKPIEKTCPALNGGRCDARSGASYKNCKVPNCIVPAPASGEYTIEAALEPVKQCEVTIHTSRLRVRRVKP